ncbi:MAG: nuclear transport factor 2 family protein [Chitinophagaceae bacterium]|nr:nuclear transport factor 2 family protein [Chitinophagaceae bacterium]
MEQLIHTFYTAFAKADWQTMANCYHEQIEFNDPVFVGLKGKEAAAMWRMLIERSKGQLKINFSNVEANEQTGKADWVAEYLFSATGRNVVNRIHAQFEFRDGKISRHTDHFDLHKWASQAMGWKGRLLGGTSFFRKKVQKTAAEALNHFLSKNI